MAVGCNVDRRTQTETWEPTTTATEICLNPQLTETTITQNFVCCNERYPVASNDNSEGFQQPLSGKPSSIFIDIHHWRPRPVPRCTLVVCLHGYVPTCWGRPGSVEWIGVASAPLFFCSLPPTSYQALPAGYFTRDKLLLTTAARERLASNPDPYHFESARPSWI